MTPQQAVVAWGLWPKVVELQQQVLMQDRKAEGRQQ
jgi:hypothetical protein